MEDLSLREPNFPHTKNLPKIHDINEIIVQLNFKYVTNLSKKRYEISIVGSKELISKKLFEYRCNRRLSDILIK